MTTSLINKSVLDNVSLIVRNYGKDLPSILPVNTLENKKTKELIKTVGQFKGLYYSIIGEDLIIRNSIHKFFSVCKDDIRINHTRFTYKDVVMAFDWIADLFEIDLNQILIPQFEYGVNLPTDRNPLMYLNGIDCYKPLQYRTFDKIHGGNELKYRSQLYDLKLYNKTYEAGIKENILRIEVRRNSSTKVLQQYQRVTDLLSHDTFAVLANDLLDKLTHVEFKNSIDMSNHKIKNINEYRLLKCLENKSPNDYLNEIKSILPESTYKNEAKRVNKFLKETNINQSEMKQDLLSKMKIELDEIIN